MSAPAPWRVDRSGGAPRLVGDDGGDAGGGDGLDRAAACVNAMAGIADPAEARRILEGMARLAEELRLRECPEGWHEFPDTPELLELAAGDAAALLWGEGWDREPSEDDWAVLDALRGGG